MTFTDVASLFAAFLAAGLVKDTILIAYSKRMAAKARAAAEQAKAEYVARMQALMEKMEGENFSEEETIAIAEATEDDALS
jgi:hypothetical protein